jgi:hypothetical protein
MKSDNVASRPDPTRLMLAYLCVATEKESSLERKVEILDKFELSDAEIARVCGSTPQSIRNARHSVRKYGSKTKKRKAPKA